MIIITVFQIRGNLFTVYNVGDGEHPLGDESARVDDGVYHVARFTRNGSRAALQLDDYAVNIRHPQGNLHLALNFTVLAIISNFHQIPLPLYSPLL